MIIYWLLAACAGLIAFMASGFHAVAYWNWVPLAPCLLVARRLRPSAQTPLAEGAAVGFLGGSLGLSLTGHVAWALDVAGFASGSSTSGHQLLVLPLYAVAAGVGGFVIDTAIRAGFAIRQSRERRRDTVPLTGRAVLGRSWRSLSMKPRLDWLDARCGRDQPLFSYLRKVIQA
jgi:hypothetical protein